MPRNGLSLAALLTLILPAVSSGQVYQAPAAQGQGPGTNVVTGGQQSNVTGPTGSVNTAQSVSGSMNGSIGDYGTAPVLEHRAQAGVMGVASPDLLPGTIETGGPAFLRAAPQTLPQRVQERGPLLSPKKKDASLSNKLDGTVPSSILERDASLNAAPQAEDQAVPMAGELGEAVAEMEKAQAEGGAAADAAVESSLNKIFDAARRAAKKSIESSQFPSVMGAMSRLEDKIRGTLGIANTASPHDAPKLYRSAMALAEESFPSRTAAAVNEAVLSSADKKAAQSLPILANEALGSASAGSEKDMERALSSLDEWESLLGSPGTPLVKNMSHLKSYVQSVFSGAASREQPSSADPAGQASFGQMLASKDIRGSVVSSARRVAARVASSGGAFNRIWFRRGRGGRAFQAVLPASAVSPVPPLAASFDLTALSQVTDPGVEVFTAFMARPTASQGFSLVYRAHRDAGRGALRSWLAAASYWTKSVLARGYIALKRLARAVFFRAPGTEEIVRLARESQVHYAAAKGLLGRPADSLAMPAVSELLRRALRLAAIYERLSADGGGVGAVTDLRRRIMDARRRAGASASDILPSEASRWVVQGDGHSLAYWVERIHALSAGQAEKAGVTQADLETGPWSGMAEESLAEKSGGARAVLGGLLADVAGRKQDAAKTAAVLSSIAPSAANYTDLGQVGSMVAQGLSLRLKDGRILLLSLLRDPDLGHIAFARAEFPETGQRVSARKLSSLLSF